jgi:hypothetical protein
VTTWLWDHDVLLFILALLIGALAPGVLVWVNEGCEAGTGLVPRSGTGRRERNRHPLGRLREDTASKAAPLGADDDSTDGVNPMCRTEV